MKTVNALATALVAGALALVSASCSSTNAAVGSKIPAPGPIMIEKGMPVADLVAAMGEPDRISPVEPPREGFEIWTYLKRSEGYDLKITGYEEVPYWNPLSGDYAPVQEPVYKEELTTRTRQTQILIGEGVVLTWKDETKENRRYND